MKHLLWNSITIFVASTSAIIKSLSHHFSQSIVTVVLHHLWLGCLKFISATIRTGCSMNLSVFVNQPIYNYLSIYLTIFNFSLFRFISLSLFHSPALFQINCFPKLFCLIFFVHSIGFVELLLLLCWCCICCSCTNK